MPETLSETSSEVLLEFLPEASRIEVASEVDKLDTDGLCLLSLDGGGVRGLSSLYILKGIMGRLNDEREDKGLPQVKPCQIFDLIGGTSTGGLIAIMLGRLEMSVDQCIEQYNRLIKQVFEKRSSRLPLNWKNGNIKARFSSQTLKQAIEDVVVRAGYSPTDKLNDGHKRGCRVFVCATAKESKSVTYLRSYKVIGEEGIPATICEAALATSAASSFFDEVTIEDRIFVDGALGANNPVARVEEEARNLWCSNDTELKPLVKCFISVGTGNPGKKAIADNAAKFMKTLAEMATETEETEKAFIARWAIQSREGRYFRLNVHQGLQGLNLAEYKAIGQIRTMTAEYLAHQDQKDRVQRCVDNLAKKQSVYIDTSL